MTRLPLTVLVSEGPIARAYLAHLRQAHLQPDRILLLVWKRHPLTARPLVPWLPRRVRIAYATRYQSDAYNYWPRRISRTHRVLVEAISGTMEALIPSARRLIEEILGSFDYRRYAGTVERLFVDSLRDRELEDYLKAHPGGAILFTGGGIVPSSLLSLPQVRFLHVHPGYLPHVRGADGLLWSILVRGRPGASCFYMAPGLDTGDVIAAREFPPLTFSLPPGLHFEDHTLYRALFSFCDPLLRAQMLVDILGRPSTDPLLLHSAPQNAAVGVTYHFMHSHLRRLALRRLFRPGDGD